MALLSFFGQTWVLAATLVAGGLVCLGDVAAGSQATRGGIERFFLNVLSLPVGVLVLIETVLRWYGLSVVSIGIGIAVGALLVGRSLREVPWTGAVSLAAAVLSVFALERYTP